MASSHSVSIRAPTLFLLYTNDLLDDVICNIAIYSNKTTLYSKGDQASDLWQQYSWLLNLNLIHWSLWTGAGSGLLISVLEKINLFHLTGLITLVPWMWKWMGLSLRKSHCLRCWVCLHWGFYITCITKTGSKKIGAGICSMKFLSPKVALIFINQPYSLSWNTLVISGLVLVVATWKC